MSQVTKVAETANGNFYLGLLEIFLLNFLKTHNLQIFIQFFRLSNLTLLQIHCFYPIRKHIYHNSTSILFVQ